MRKRTIFWTIVTSVASFILIGETWEMHTTGIMSRTIIMLNQWFMTIVVIWALLDDVRGLINEYRQERD